MKKQKKSKKCCGKKGRGSGKRVTKGAAKKGVKKEPKKKRGLKRKQTKYPGLAKGVNGKFRQDTIDFDYLDKLTDKEKKWLSDFMEETNGANFKHKGKKFYKTTEEKREIYHRNNARNRDLMNHQKAKGLLVDDSKLRERDDTVSQEDVMIDAIDSSGEEDQ